MAKDLLTKYGPSKAKALLPPLVKRLQEKFPDAKWFGAASVFVPEVVSAYEREQRAIELRKQEERREEEEENKRYAQRMALEQQWRPVWEELSAEERSDIQKRVLTRMPFLEKTPAMLERFCLSELMRQRQSETQVMEE